MTLADSVLAAWYVFTMNKPLVVAAAAVMLALAGCSSEPAAEAAAPSATTTTAPSSTPARSSVSSRPDLTPEQTDATFLQVLDSYGVDYGTDSGVAAIHLADTVCSGLDRGLRESDLMVILTDTEATNLTSTDAANFLNSSIVAYCPEHS